MKVIHIETGRYLYGGAAQVMLLIKGLRDYPAGQVLICTRGSAIAGAVKALDVIVYEEALGGDLDFSMIAKLRRIIRHERPDLVHVHSRRGADLWGGLAARLEKVPAVLSRRVDNPVRFFSWRLKKALYARIVVISQAIADILIEQGGVPGSRISLVYSAVDTQRFKPGGDRQKFRARFDLQPDELCVGMLAQFIERKGHRFLVQVMPAILEQYPRTRFLLFGRGPLREEIRKLCRDNQLTDRVIFAGFCNDMEHILPCLDLVVHPARREGLGVALLEASACGVPVVAFNAGGLREVIDSGKTGFLVEPGNTQGFVKAVSDLLAAPEKAEQFGRNARQRIIETFSADAMVRGNFAVYRELSAGK